MRIALVLLTLLCATLAALWGYLGLFTDTLVQHGAPLQTFASPDGRWELRVYEVAAGPEGAEDTGQWLATVRSLGRPEERERVILRGYTASLRGKQKTN